VIRITEHTRRKAAGKCSLCPSTIEPGERYRQLVQVGETDIWGVNFGRWMAHVLCAQTCDHSECWELTIDTQRFKAAEKALNQKAIDDWNATHNNEGGVRVRYWPWVRSFDADGSLGVTSGPAFLNAAGHPVVHIRGCSVMALGHVTALAA